MKLFLLIFAVFAAMSEHESKLLFPEWEGPMPYLVYLQKNKVEVCPFLKNMREKYKEESIIRRTLLVQKGNSCDDSLLLVKRYIDDKNPVMRAAALDLGAALTKEDRSKLTAQVNTMKAQEKDALVKEALTRFLQSP
jgi:hypothetical protein